MNEKDYNQIAFIDSMSGYQFVSFGKDLLKWIEIEPDKYGSMEKTGNYAFVSQEKKCQCYIENNQYQIDICGKQYRVLDFFETADKAGQQIHQICLVGKSNVWQ